MSKISSPVPVILQKMAGHIKGFCCLGSDYEPIIVLNDQLSPEQKEKTILHELDHIRRGELWDVSFDEYGE